MPKIFRILTAVLAVAGLVLSLTACGGGIPGNGVAKVGDTVITKKQFNHWMVVAGSSSAASDPTASATSKPKIPDAPDFKQCIADKKATAPAPAKGQPNPTTAQYKAQCKQQYDSLKDQVMQFLVSSVWIENETKARNVKVTDKEVQKQFQTTKKQSFPKAADFNKFLKSSGMTLTDLLFRVKLDTLSTKLRTSVTKGKDKVTTKQIQAYYDKNKARFAQPERRDLRIVLTKTPAQANAAKKALQGGQGWKAVAKKYSIDQASKDQGGVLLAVAKGQQEPSLDKAVFAAKKGELSGPVKTQFGYYIFSVQKITAATQQTVAQATQTIKALLASQNQQTALDTFVKDFRKKWTKKTDCRKEFITTDCSNAPKTKTTSTPTATPTPTPQTQSPPATVEATPTPTATTG